MASLDRKSNLKFSSRGTFTTSKERKRKDKICTFYRYFIICGSLAWYWHGIWLATSWESLLAFSLVTPISRARIILAMRALYSAWLLLAVHSNFNACSITILLGPSRSIPASLPFTLEAPSTDDNHSERGSRLWASWVLLRTWIGLKIWCLPWDVLDIVLRELFCPVYHSSSQVVFFQNVSDEIVGFYLDLVPLKVWPEFSCRCRNNNSQRWFLNFMVAHLGAFEHLTYKIHRFPCLVYFLDEDWAHHLLYNREVEE